MDEEYKRKIDEMVGIDDYVCKNDDTGDKDHDASVEDCATMEGYSWSEDFMSCQALSDYFSANPQSCSDSSHFVSTCCDDVQQCNIKNKLFFCVFLDHSIFTTMIRTIFIEKVFLICF